MKQPGFTGKRPGFTPAEEENQCSLGIGSGWNAYGQ